ncbi:aminoacyl-tRNA hydrolase [Candidatus Peregrinibacteria bacterium CG11_big_fil_rev_8_21_14_0_20_46_8]|nr:MAG: aminoacyl-tRNA hydrolase [Candidatus Peregrinibacteria bacterium CG11_big_fil_rev_8_21_14_0_20_46_8]
MKLIVGLGNPGKKYEGTRHNAGFMCVDMVQRKFELPEFKLHNKAEALAAEGEVMTPAELTSKENRTETQREKILLIKPLTFMNLSGNAVARLKDFYKIAPENILIIYDDIDLPLGTIRMRKEGGPGTHNGMKSIIESLGTENFPRIRIGIESRGVSAPAQQDLHSFVLSPFLPEEIPQLNSAVAEACEAAMAFSLAKP